MAPRNMERAAPKSRMDSNLKVRAKRVKAEMGKVRADQECLREEQREMTRRFGEIQRQCDQLKEETEMIMKQSAMTRFKLVLMFRILKAREGGHSIEAANLTRLLREIVAMEKANPIFDEVKDEEEDP